MTRLLQSPPMTRRRWLLPVATNWEPITSAKTNPAQAAWMSNAGTVQLQPVLDQVGRRGERHVGREGGEHQQVDVRGLAIGRFQAADRRLRAEVAGRLVRQREPSLVDSCPVDDPFGIEAEGVLQVVIADHVVGNVAARSQDLHAR